MGYAHTDGADGTLRPTSLTYPNGRTLAYGYGAAGSADQAANRVAALTWDGTVVEEIDRLGSGAAAELRLPQPDVRRLWKLGGIDPDTGDAYGGRDRFGREVKTRWRAFPSQADLVSQNLSYDRASSRTFRRDLAAEAAGADRDELYGHDALRRLKNLARGTLNAAGDAVTGETFAQCWSLDATGNWRSFRQGANSGAWNLAQTRTANAVNEITGVAETAGPAWATPAYDPAGNMTNVPKPEDPTGTFAATYDAWNRLVRLEDGGGAVVQQNAYDGRGFRVTRTTPAETRHFYYADDWRVLEERVGISTAAERQFVWGTRYVDELVLRDRDADGTGTLGERLYALQDANWNVVALADDAGAVRERYGYAAYGQPTVLTPAWGTRTGSDFGWETRYAGYRFEPVGIYHVRYRALHPGLGCWLTRDPVGYAGGSSLYQYASSQPHSSLDPSGLLPPVPPEDEWINRIGGSRGAIHPLSMYDQDVQAFLHWYDHAVECGSFEGTKNDFYELLYVTFPTALTPPPPPSIPTIGPMDPEQAEYYRRLDALGPAPSPLNYAATPVYNAELAALHGDRLPMALLSAEVGMGLASLGMIRFSPRRTRLGPPSPRPLYSYSPRPASFSKGFQFSSGSGRCYLTSHAPGDWMFERGVAAGLRRSIRVGRYSPYPKNTTIFSTGNQPPQAFGLRRISPTAYTRIAKFLGGQYETKIGTSGFRIDQGPSIVILKDGVFHQYNLAPNPIASNAGQIRQAQLGAVAEGVQFPGTVAVLTAKGTVVYFESTTE